MAWMLMGKLLPEQAGSQRLHRLSRKPPRTGANFFQWNHKGHKEHKEKAPKQKRGMNRGVCSLQRFSRVFFVSFVSFVFFVVQIALAVRRGRV
jgi:hypothetical protein